MREIKFRAWDKADKKMLYNVYPAPNGDMAGDYNGRFCLRLPADRVELMQFTGLKDKNGVEIYEGDIVRHIRSYSFGDDYYTGEPVDIDKTRTIIGKVIFRPMEGFIIIGESNTYNNVDGIEMFNSKWNGLPSLMSSCAEVIGNIHDNKHLLK